jgi:putative membrane protein
MNRIPFLVCAGLLSLQAFAADTTSTGNLSTEQVFVNKAAQAGMAEVELGKLAQRRGTDPAVKEFAGQMVKDHEKANAELRALAEKKKLDVPTALDGEHATVMHRLSAKPASEFDSEYSKQMVKAHDAAVTLFSDAAALRDKDLAAFAKATLPTLRNHQQMAATLPAQAPPRPETATPNEALTPVPHN